MVTVNMLHNLLKKCDILGKRRPNEFDGRQMRPPISVNGIDQWHFKTNINLILHNCKFPL